MKYATFRYDRVEVENGLKAVFKALYLVKFTAQKKYSIQLNYDMSIIFITQNNSLK